LADAKTLLPRQCSAGNSLPFAGDGFGAAFSLSFEINAPLGFAGSCSSK
jgi:hypothetical protein